MPINLPDLIQHNNVSNYPIADSNSVRGGTRSAVAAVTDLYTIPTNLLKQNATRVWVTAASKFYTLTDIANAGNSTGWTADTASVTSVTGTSPVASSGGTTPAISLASAYGDTLNPYASKTANFVLAAPNGSAGVPTFRAIVAADIPTLNQNTTGTASNVTGTVAIANGGTGATTQSSALTALLPSQSLQSGKVLGTNGSTASWVTAGTGTVTSVDFSGGSTGLTASGVPVTTSGTITLAGTLAIGYGGTGISTSGWTAGQTLYYSGTGTALTRLSGNTTTAKQFLTQTGNGTTPGAPAWGTVDQSDVFSGLTTGRYIKATSSSAIGDGPMWHDTTARDSRTAYLQTSSSTSTTGASVGGVVYHTSTEVGTDASTAEKIALSVTQPFFPYQDFWIRVKGYFKFAANGNSKTIRVRIGKAGYTTTYFDAASVVSSASGSVIYMEIMITRDSGGNWASTGFVKSTTAAVETVFDKTTYAGSWTTTNDKVEIILQTGTAAANNVIMRDATIEWGPAGG